MDIYLRNIDESYVKIIDERSESLGISRNAYVKKIIEYDAMDNMFTKERNRNRDQLKRIADALEIIMNRTKELEDKNLILIKVLSHLTELDLMEAMDMGLDNEN